MIKSSKRVIAVTALGAAATLALTACGGGSGFNSSTSSAGASASANKNDIQVLIGSSGDAETKAVTDAVAAWSAKSGIKATVVASSALDQDAAKGFAAGKP